MYATRLCLNINVYNLCYFYISTNKRGLLLNISVFLIFVNKTKAIGVRKVAKFLEIFNIHYFSRWFFFQKDDLGMSACLLRFSTFIAERYFMYKLIILKFYPSKHALIFQMKHFFWCTWSRLTTTQTWENPVACVSPPWEKGSNHSTINF